MWEPPTTIACTNVSTLRPGRDPPTRPASRTALFTSRSRSSRTTSVDTRSSPALATRFGSSKVTSTRSIRCDTRFTGCASWVRDLGDVRHRHRPYSGGTVRGWAPASDHINRWIEVNTRVIHHPIDEGGDHGRETTKE